jgi:hypothetical protein
LVDTLVLFLSNGNSTFCAKFTMSAAAWSIVRDCRVSESNSSYGDDPPKYRSSYHLAQMRHSGQKDARSITTVAAPMAWAYIPVIVVLSRNVYPREFIALAMGTSPGVMITT